MKHSVLTEQDFSEIPALELNEPATRAINPAVSVLVLVYQHADFLQQALDSILGQQLAAPYEILIGEDASDDGSWNICRQFAEQHSGVVRLIHAPKNVGMHKNFARLWHRARAPLLAFCEGDDYWTDPAKLQHQLDWFAAHPDGSLCGTDCEKLVQTENGTWEVDGMANPARPRENYTIEDLLRRYTFHFSTVMVRKACVQFPRWFWDVYCVDRPLYLLAAEQGRVGHVAGATSVYRQHRGGIWSPRSTTSKGAASTLLFRRLEQHFGPHYQPVCHQALAGILWSYMADAIDSGDMVSARALYRMAVREDPWGMISNRPMALVSTGLQINFPALYRTIKRRPGAGAHS